MWLVWQDIDKERIAERLKSDENEKKRGVDIWDGIKGETDGVNEKSVCRSQRLWF